jgi:uncharacterized protein (DUF3084 family)
MNIEIVLVLAVAGLASSATVAGFVASRSVRRWRAQCDSLEANLAALRREMELVASISVRTGRRVQRVAHEFSGVTERVELFESRAATASPSLDQAIDLARRGACSERLEQQFGLSSGEADLVARLHGRGAKLN